MKPGNAAALHSQLQDFSAYDAIDFTLDEEVVTVYHCQYAKYPIQRAVEAVYEQLQFTPSDHTTYESFREMYFDTVTEDIETALEDLDGVVVNIHDQSYFERGEYIDPIEISSAATTLVKFYDGFESDGNKQPYERYAEPRDIPETKAQLTADLFSIYHVELALDHIDEFRFQLLDKEWTQEEASIALFAMRDAIERQHGWSVFDVPDPSAPVVEQIWKMADEVGFEPRVEWVYALYLSPSGAKLYSPNDATDRSIRSSLGNLMSPRSGMDMRYVEEGRTPAEVQEHADKMLTSVEESTES